MAKVKPKAKGRMSIETEEYILANYASKSIKELADETGYSPRGIKTFVKRIGIENTLRVDEDLKRKLYREPFWGEIKNQLLDDEVNNFVFKWAAILEQFNHDILPTEKLQLARMIIVQILQARCITQNTDCIKNARELEIELINERNKGGEADFAQIARLQSMIKEYKVSADNYLKQSAELAKESEKLFSALKARREDRVRTIQDASKSFTTALELLDDEEIRIQLGREITLLNLAQQKAKHKLMTVHQYIDGKYDYPLLSYESVDFLDELNSKQEKENENTNNGG